jgi:hypothetical protein
MELLEVDTLQSNLSQVLDQPSWPTEITVSVGGLRVTGTPITETEYLEHLELHLDETLQRSGAEHPSMKQTLGDIAQRVRSLRDSGTSHDSVLLAKATLFADGSSSVSVPLWRVPLNAVSSWSLGRAT